MAIVVVARARRRQIDVLSRLDGDRAQVVQRFERQRRRGGMLFLAKDGEAVVGQLYVRLDRPEEPELARFWPHTPFLERALVAERHRSRGVGTELFAAAERWLRKRGHRSVALAVGTENKDARRLYERLGYRDWAVVLCRARGAHPGTPPAEVCMVMTKSLLERGGRTG